jgi:hypothetical protein
MRRMIVVGLVTLALSSPALAQTTPAPARAPAEAAATAPEMRELIDAAKATAKATRENVEYVRVVPDMMYQILAKLDKIEAKLDKVENAIKADNARAKR